MRNTQPRDMNGRRGDRDSRAGRQVKERQRRRARRAAGKAALPLKKCLVSAFAVQVGPLAELNEVGPVKRVQ
jgi:hypothetical protein